MSKNRIVIRWITYCFGVLAFTVVADVGKEVSAGAGAEVGQEMKKSEEKVREAPAMKDPAEIEAFAPPEPEMKTPTDKTGLSNTVERIVFRGDSEWLRLTGWASALEKQLVGRPWVPESAAKAVYGVNRQAISNGFYLASLWLPETQAYSNGVLSVEVDAGRMGKRSILFSGDRVNGRFFSSRQIERRFRDIPEGEPFNYFTFYDRFYSLNAHPDLIADVDLRVRTVPDEAGRSKRYVDMDFDVTESFPFHAVLDIDNYSTDASDNWAGRLTLQYLNLTKADDVLTVSGQSSLEVGALYGGAASYHRPHHLGKGGALTLYGGYTEVDAEDVVPQIDVTGEGWFVGLQGSLRLIDTPRYLLSASLGMVHRYVENGLVVEGFETLPVDVTIRPVSLALMFSDKTSDALNGRNYLTLEGVYNKGDFAGTSDEIEIKAQRVNAEEDYFIFRGQAARVQTFGGSRQDDGTQTGRWIAFMKVQGQYADGALVYAEQMGLGGANSVRGYKEREFLGDHAVTGTIEIRTPLLLGMFSRLAQYANSAWTPGETPLDRVQIVAFADAGYMEIEDPLPGEDDSQSLASVGAGLRLAITQYAQLKFDWGFPMEETSESDSSGRGHLNLQMQF